ncbi:MAG TPA: hypothetical protein DDX29_01280 [Clostridiales bacterium]|nr:hypothetical protein [Clostridiales bacterium]
MPKLTEDRLKLQQQVEHILKRKLQHRILPNNYVREYYPDFKPTFVSIPIKNQEEIHYSLLMPDYNKTNLIRLLNRIKNHIIFYDSNSWKYNIFVKCQDSYHSFKDEQSFLDALKMFRISVYVVYPSGHFLDFFVAQRL